MDNGLLKQKLLKFPSLSGADLKWIAIVTMFIDHVGAAILEPCMVLTTGETYARLRMLDRLLRSIGRLAFPIFIFLLIEGFFHTRNRRKYFIRLLIFSFISDIPFDLAFFLNKSNFLSGQFMTMRHQNVFFTLSIGFLCIWLMEILRQRLWEKWQAVWFLAAGGIALAGGWASKQLHTDYSWSGVLGIVMGYLGWILQKLWMTGKETEMLLILTPLILKNSFEAMALADIVFIHCYTGEKGKSMNRWFFYVFYPAHLLLLWGIRMLILL